MRFRRKPKAPPAPVRDYAAEEAASRDRIREQGDRRRAAYEAGEPAGELPDRLRRLRDASAADRVAWRQFLDPRRWEAPEWEGLAWRIDPELDEHGSHYWIKGLDLDDGHVVVEWMGWWCFSPSWVPTPGELLGNAVANAAIGAAKRAVR